MPLREDPFACGTLHRIVWMKSCPSPSILQSLEWKLTTRPIAANHCKIGGSTESKVLKSLHQGFCFIGTRRSILSMLRRWKLRRCAFQQVSCIQRTKDDNLIQCMRIRGHGMREFEQGLWLTLTAPIHCSQLRGWANHTHDSTMLTNFSYKDK